MFPANRAVDNKKNARDRNVNVNSANAKNKAEVAAKNVVAANRADDRPGYLEKGSGGSCSRRFSFCRSRELPMLPLSQGPLAIRIKQIQTAKLRLAQGRFVTLENLPA
jgi:hypothetical protein